MPHKIISKCKRDDLSAQIELTKDQQCTLDNFVKQKYQQLKENFTDCLVAADASLMNLIYVLENYVVTAYMICESRKRLGIRIPKKQEYHWHRFSSRSDVRLVPSRMGDVFTIMGGRND